jgi:hypothetical protein
MKRPHALWGTAPLAVVLFDRGPAASRATHPSDHRARFRAPARPPRRPPDALAGPDGAALQSGRGAAAQGDEVPSVVDHQKARDSGQATILDG